MRVTPAGASAGATRTTGQRKDRSSTLPRGRRPGARRASGERGSVLLLVPAGVLVVIVLAAIAADTANVLMVRSELQSVAQAAANDAATAALDHDALRSGRGLVLDQGKALRVAQASVRASGLADDLAEDPVVALDPTGRGITVQLAAEVGPIFGSALPGGDRPKLVSAAATALPEQR